MNPALHILGGGPAGLAAAHYAHRRGLAFRLHEAGEETGGNCRTLRLGDCLFDTGAHRLHARDPEATREFRDLLGDDLLTVDAPSRIVHNGRLLRFPLTALDLLRHLSPRLTARIGREILAQRKAPERPENFEALAVGRYGKTLADLFLLGYTRKLWGRDPADLSPAVAGGRLDGLDAGSALRAALGLRARPEARHLDGSFLYPKHGIGSLFRALENRLPPDSVRTGSRVTRIRHDEGKSGARIHGITTFTASGTKGAEDIPVDRVVSTLPLPVFLRALDPLPPPDILELANGIAFRNLILCVLRLDADRFSENASLYFPDPDAPFTRLYEPANRSPFMAPRGQTCVVLEAPCDPGDALWNAPDAEWIARAEAHVRRIPGAPKGLRIPAATVMRISHAYPVLERNAASTAEALLEYCGRFSNLRLAGRNALFRYAHIHDMFRQGREAVEGFGGEPARN
jgi:protoporphyrinogen oxidase